MLTDNSDQTQQQWLEDLLAAQADYLLAGADDFDPHFEQHHVKPAQAAEATELFDLAYMLRDNLSTAEPSEAFMARLKSELVGEAPITLAVRWRKLPAQYQLAAKLGGMTITAGIMLLAARGALQRRHHDENADAGLSFNTASTT